MISIADSGFLHAWRYAAKALQIGARGYVSRKNCAWRCRGPQLRIWAQATKPWPMRRLKSKLGVGRTADLIRLSVEMEIGR